MSFNPYQQIRVNALLESSFKKTYDLIPVEYKNNHYFEKFLVELAHIYNCGTHCKGQVNELHPIEFDYNVFDDGFGNSILDITLFFQDDEKTDKRTMTVTMKKDGSLHFSWVFGYAYKKPYNLNKDDTHYELAMKFSDDGKNILVERTTSSNNHLPFKCYMSSIFDIDGNEISRVAEGMDNENNRLVFHEEYYPAGEMTLEQIKYLSSVGKSTQFQSFTNKQEVVSSNQQITHQVFLCRCQTGEITRYAICWKQETGADSAYDRTFETVSDFGAIGFNLSRQIDRNEKFSLIEISKEAYESVISNLSNLVVPQLKMQLN